MKTVFRSITAPALALFVAAALLAPAGAQAAPKHAATCNMPGMTAKTTGVPPSIAAIKLPITFVCKHCGIKMTIKTQADWLKPCPACPCGTAAWQCYPTKGK